MVPVARLVDRTVAPSGASAGRRPYRVLRGGDSLASKGASMTVGEAVALRTRAGVVAGRRIVRSRSKVASNLAIPAYWCTWASSAPSAPVGRAMALTGLRPLRLLVDAPRAGLHGDPPR